VDKKLVDQGQLVLLLVVNRARLIWDGHTTQRALLLHLWQGERAPQSDLLEQVGDLGALQALLFWKAAALVPLQELLLAHLLDLRVLRDDFNDGLGGAQPPCLVAPRLPGLDPVPDEQFVCQPVPPFLHVSALQLHVD